MRVLIFEDETLAAEKLQNSLKEIDPSIEVLASIATISGAVAWLQKNQQPDLIISDIRLLDGLCFEIFKQVKVVTPVIFTTAYDQYAIKAFEVNSIDYLLKPVQAEKLKASLHKLKNIAKPSAEIPDYEKLLKYLKSAQPEYKSRFMVRLGQKIVAVPVDKIAYFYSEHKLTNIITGDGKRFPIDQTLEELEALLDPLLFFRINRQFIISFSSIGEMHPYFKGRIKLVLQPKTDEDVVISSERTPEFKKWIDQ